MENSIDKWAMVKSKIREAQTEAREKVLAQEGLTKTAFTQLEANAFDEMGAEEIITTDYGTVQKQLKSGRIDWKPMSSMEAQENKRKSLIFISLREE